MTPTHLHTRNREPSPLRPTAIVFGWVLGAYLVVRAVVELVNVDYGNAASYRNDWGGPSLAGVLAVHVGPGLLVGAFALVRLLRFRRR